LDET
jgi:DNA repair exonuclease SbcCD ATPase subunit